MDVLVEADRLRKTFGPITAVDDISLSVRKGEVLGFLGPNGAGKSTTMKMLTGFLEADSGTASICGHDVSRDPQAAKACVGYLPEGAPAYGDMTPKAFLRFIADIRGLGIGRRENRISAAIDRTGLEGVLDQRIETLSKGFKRRVGLAQAILHDPPVLIMDEPTDGLDPNQKHLVRTLISEMAKDKAIIVSTHILEEVEAVCTRAVVIDRGRIVADGTAEDLQSRAALSQRRGAPRRGEATPSGSRPRSPICRRRQGRAHRSGARTASVPLLRAMPASGATLAGRRRRAAARQVARRRRDLRRARQARRRVPPHHFAGRPCRPCVTSGSSPSAS